MQDLSSRSALRRLMQQVPSARAVTGTAAPLERLPGEGDLPHLVDADVVEDATLRAHAVPGAPVAAFGAFLDGTQESHVLAWVGPAPIVFGTTGATIRERIDRRLVTSTPPIITRRLYAPLVYAPRDALLTAFAPGAVCDTAAPDAQGEVPPPHPALLLERARLAVSRDRDAAERALAEHWCRTHDAPLWIDGGIGGSEIVARAGCAVGVVKSHRTIYLSGAAVETVLALGAGERSSVLRIAPRHSRAVLSWYLRVRDGTGDDAFFGIVRVEVADVGAPAARADEVSRWVLAESTPLALPDPRWDRMPYGVRMAEMYLRAIT